MNDPALTEDRSLLAALIGDGRPLLSLTGVALLASGGFALFLSVTGHFLPHDVQFLGMTAAQLCGIQQCRIVHFMFHDRVAFGGALVAIATLYLWLAAFPLRRGEAWAWWLFVLSGVTGFGSFLAYLGYGYLDTWHGVATLVLLPCYLVGLVQSRRELVKTGSWRSLLKPAARPAWNTRAGIGRACLLATSAGLVLAGATILTVGMTSVFVPTDLKFIGLNAADLHAINPHLIPLIAHDRAGFGGGIGSCGLLMFFCVWCGAPSRSLWQALAVAGGAGFAAAIGVHPVIGYTDFFHIAPAVTGAVLFFTGLLLARETMFTGSCLDSGSNLSADLCL